MKDDDSETEISNEGPLAWTMIHCPRNSVYMITATLLMKLYFCDVMNSLLENLSLYKNVEITVTLCICIVCWHSAYGRNVLLKQIRSSAILFGRAALFITPIRGCFVAFKRSRMYLRIGLFHHFHLRPLFLNILTVDLT